MEKEKLNELAGLLRGLTELPVCGEGLCIKKLDNKIDCYQEEKKMCDCKCQHPEKLKGKPGDCSLKQIKECHGDEKGHPCGEIKEKEKGA